MFDHPVLGLAHVFGKEVQLIVVPEKSFTVKVQVAFPRGRELALVGIVKFDGIDRADLLVFAKPDLIDDQVPADIGIVAKIANVKVSFVIAGNVFPVHIFGVFNYLLVQHSASGAYFKQEVAVATVPVREQCEGIGAAPARFADGPPPGPLPGGEGQARTFPDGIVQPTDASDVIQPFSALKPTDIDLWSTTKEQSAKKKQESDGFWGHFLSSSFIFAITYNLNFIVMNPYSKITALLSEVEDDFTKFYEQGNQAAGTRVRKAMLDLKNLSQEIRLEVQDIKNKKGEEK